MRQSFQETHLSIGEMQCLEDVLIDYFIKTINDKQRFEKVSKHDDMAMCNWNKTWRTEMTKDMHNEIDKHGTSRESNDPYVVIWRWFGQDKDVGAKMTRRWWHDNRQANLMTEMVAGMVSLVEKDVEIEFNP